MSTRSRAIGAILQRITLSLMDITSTIDERDIRVRIMEEVVKILEAVRELKEMGE